jgi:hypothetical protein
MITRLKLLPHRKLCALDRRTAAAKSIILQPLVLSGVFDCFGTARFSRFSWDCRAHFNLQLDFK